MSPLSHWMSHSSPRYPLPEISIAPKILHSVTYLLFSPYSQLNIYECTIFKKLFWNYSNFSIDEYVVDEPYDIFLLSLFFLILLKTSNSNKKLHHFYNLQLWIKLNPIVFNIFYSQALTDLNQILNPFILINILVKPLRLNKLILTKS